MKKKQFNEVCKLADEILQSQSASSTRLAIPYLHVVRPHHIFLKKYESIYDHSIIRYFKNTKQMVINIISLFVVLVQSIFYSRCSQWLYGFNFKSDKHILFISHLINKSQHNQDEDFYFSTLPQKVSDAGYKPLVVMINHIGRKGVRNNDDNEKFLKRIILPLRLGFFDELKNLGLLWKEYKVLKNEMRFEKNKNKFFFIRMTATDALSTQSLTSLRIARQVEGLLEIFRSKALITTYEGQAWERKVFDNARSLNQNIKCIAYTHAPIFKNQHAIKRSLSKQYNPDIILVSGRAQKKQLEKNASLKNIQIAVLGSIRFNNANQIESLTNKKQQFCLVAPEGIKKEIEILFDFSLECAKLMPECQFIWRLHPHSEFNKVRYSSLPENIMLSDQKLHDDLLQSQWILYRGSSVVIQAVIAGLKPIYLHISEEIKVDTIYEIQNWKSEVKSIKEFELTVRQKKGIYSDYQKALKDCLDINSPLDVKVLINAIRDDN